MKVIKRIDTGAWTKEHTCYNCGSELVIEEGDLVEVGGQGYPHYGASCSVCGQDIDVWEGELPERVKESVQGFR
jgi:transcription elongation factor Elf1